MGKHTFIMPSGPAPNGAGMKRRADYTHQLVEKFIKENVKQEKKEDETIQKFPSSVG